MGSRQALGAPSQRRCRAPDRQAALQEDVRTAIQVGYGAGFQAGQDAVFQAGRYEGRKRKHPQEEGFRGAKAHCALSLQEQTFMGGVVIPQRRQPPLVVVPVQGGPVYQQYPLPDQPQTVYPLSQWAPQPEWEDPHILLVEGVPTRRVRSVSPVFQETYYQQPPLARSAPPVFSQTQYGFGRGGQPLGQRPPPAQNPAYYHQAPDVFGGGGQAAHVRQRPPPTEFPAPPPPTPAEPADQTVPLGGQPSPAVPDAWGESFDVAAEIQAQWGEQNATDAREGFGIPGSYTNLSGIGGNF